MRYFLLLIFACIALLPGSGQAQDHSSGWFDLGFEFSSGTYGTPVRTNSVFVPATIGFTPSENWDISLEIPLVYQSNNNVVAGQYRQMQVPSTGTQTMIGAMAAQGGSKMGRSESSTSRSQQGLGDITLRSGYIMQQEGGLMPQLRPIFSVKFPTGDRGRGLGTGTYEGGLSVECSKWFGDWLFVVDPGYVIQSRSSSDASKNYVTYNGAIGYQLTDRFRPALVIKGSGAPVEQASSLLEARLKFNYVLGQGTGINAYLAKGITDSSQDYGVGLAVYYDF